MCRSPSDGLVQSAPTKPLLWAPCRMAAAAIAAAMVQHLPGRLGKHGRGRAALHHVLARQLRRSCLRPALPALQHWHLRLLLGLHSLQPLHHRHLRSPPGALTMTRKYSYCFCLILCNSFPLCER
jgi:hypothetical protein